MEGEENRCRQRSQQPQQRKAHAYLESFHVHIRHPQRRNKKDYDQYQWIKVSLSQEAIPSTAAYPSKILAPPCIILSLGLEELIHSGGFRQRRRTISIHSFSDSIGFEESSLGGYSYVEQKIQNPVVDHSGASTTACTHIESTARV